MDELLPAAERAGKDLERRLAGLLSGLFGGMVRAYLPQTWLFVSERETVRVTVGPDGKVVVAEGATPSPDVTVEGSHDRLSAALSRRDPGALPPGALTVTPHTARGRAAAQYLRGPLGL